MTRSGRGLAASALLGLTALTVTASRGDHLPRGRELPPYAVQPPGASFERNVTNRQKALLFKDGLRATVAAAVAQPVRSTAVGAHRLAERFGVRAAGAVPRVPVPGRQSSEAGGPCTPARLTPLYDSRPAYDALLDLVASARHRIDLMIFGWDDDVAGRPVAAALIEKARAGVPVRVMVDRGGYVSGEGNARVALGCATFLDALRGEPNVRVIEAPDPLFRYDHRKIAVIDDRVVWTGGMILTRPALVRWHNFAFLAEGAIVPQYAALFADRWESLGGCRAPVSAGAAGAIAAAVPNASVRMVRTDDGRRSLKEAVYGAVDSAKHHIYIENPYFSDQILTKKLAAARARGVDVRAVLTMRGDVRTMNKFVALTANHLLRGGVRVYLYPAMTHVKAMSVDGDLAYIGTGNFDELSLRNNREAALTVRGPALVREIESNLFLHDMAVSEELHALLPLPKGWFFLEASRLWY